MRIFACLLLCCFYGMAQQTKTVDFLKIEATIEPISSDKSVKGTMKCIFKVLQSTDSIYLDAVNMKILDVALEGTPVTASESKIWFVDSFEENKEYTAFFEYEATPRQAIYFMEDQVWTQGQGKYTSHWLPSIDDMNDKIEFDLTFKAPVNKSIVANGQLVSVQKKDSIAYWKWDMKQSMSSYLVAFVMGDFEKTTVISNSQIPIELYYNPSDTLKVEPTYRYTKEIFDFLEREIGIPYPWQNYKQIPVRDFLYAGMENTTATVFSQAFVVDSVGFIDKNYVYVNAHEMAHQWFGNLVTETEGTHHWLHEGFATYYALLAEKEIFGEDYYYWKLLQSADQLKSLSEDGKGESLLDPKAGSLTFYEKGAWALHILKEQIGPESFKEAVQLFLTKHQFSNVTTPDFLNEVRRVSNVDITEWEMDWLLQNTFNESQAINSLMRSSCIQDYFRFKALRAVALKDKKGQLMEALSSQNDFVAQEAIYQLSGEPISESLEIYLKGFESNNLFVRQAIALTLEQIPYQLQEEFERLLNDESYITKEAALYRLWANFPENRSIYLDRLQGVDGFQDKNIRQLWLTLAYVTPSFNDTDKPKFLNELKNYTSSEYSFEIRQKAIEYLNELQLIDEEVLKNMLNASTHHTWRFRKYVREVLIRLLSDDYYRQMAHGMKDALSIDEQRYLDSIIGN